MATRINPVPLTALIVCVIFTLAFTVLVIVKSGDVRRLYEGDPERAAFKPIPKLKEEVNLKLNKIESAQKAINARKQELYRLDLRGNAARLYYTDGELLGGVSTPGNTDADIRGASRKLKDSTWKLTSDLIAMDAGYLDKLKAEYEGPERQTFPQLDEAIKKRQDELRDVLKKISDQEASFQADKERLAAQLETLTAERDKAEKKTHEDTSLRLSHINQLEDRIRDLLELDIHWMVDHDKAGKIIGNAGLDPDGTVIQADGQYQKVIINRGSHDNVFPGLLFEVFSYNRGAYLQKGRVEVIEVQDEISTCRMISQADAKRNPIASGDYIGNPVFDSRKPKVFVVAGEFKHYNKEDLETFIRRTGGVVREKLGPGCDFLVVQGESTDRSDAERAAARQYQILVIREDELLQFVQTTFAPKADKAPVAAPAPAPAAAPAAPAADK